MDAIINHVVVGGVRVSMADANVDWVCVSNHNAVIQLTTWDHKTARVTLRRPVMYMHEPSGDLSHIDVKNGSGHDLRGAVPPSLYADFCKWVDDAPEQELAAIRFVSSEDQVIVFFLVPQAVELEVVVDSDTK